MQSDHAAARGGATAARVPVALLGEQALARMAARGERRAFEAIFERYHQELHRYCRAIVGNPQDAQDALQSTMAAALRALPGRSSAVALRPWLYRVAHNESISLLRSRGTGIDLDSLPEPAIPGVDQDVEQRERLTQLVSDLAALPDRQRGALVMRELNGLGYDEIGTAMETSEAAARQLVYEARVGLRELDLGRGMECETAREALSARDGRMLRGRRLRAHLKVCEPCQDFRAAIGQRRTDLAALCPPLPAAAASALLANVLGGTGSAATGGAAGGVLAGSLAAKGASIAAALAIGAGAASLSGTIDLPVIGGGGNDSSGESAAGPASSSGGHAAAAATRHAAGAAHARDAKGAATSAQHRQDGGSHGNGNSGAHTNNGHHATPSGGGAGGTSAGEDTGSSAHTPNLGNSMNTPAATHSNSPNHTGEVRTPPGQEQSAEVHSTTHGQSGLPHGQSDDSHGQSDAEHGKP